MLLSEYTDVYIYNNIYIGSKEDTLEFRAKKILVNTKQFPFQKA